MKQFKTHLTEMLKNLPKPELPALLKEGRKRTEITEIETIANENEYDYKLEKELKEIQKKLAELH